MPLVAWPPTLFGTLKGFQTSCVRYGKQACLRSGWQYELRGACTFEPGLWAPGLPKKVIWSFDGYAEVPDGPRSDWLELGAHHYFLVRYAVYKVENEVQ